MTSPTLDTATKLRVDFTPRSWRGQAVTDNELIAQLCVRIGMIMEDVCGEAVMVRAGNSEQLAAVVAKLDQASERISALTNAARALAVND